MFFFLLANLFVSSLLFKMPRNFLCFNLWDWQCGLVKTQYYSNH